MHISILDPYIDRPSLIHVLDPRIKLILTIAYILTCALLPSGAWPAYLILFALIFSAVILSNLGVGFVLKRALLALPFVLAALPILFTQPGPVAWRIPLGFTTLVVTQPGLERFLSITFKSWVSVQAAILLASTMPFPDLLLAMRAVKFPRLLVAIIGLMWRYLFVLADETLRLIRARASRSAETADVGRRTGGSIAWRARVTGGMVGNLFLRSFDRSDRIYLAMISRGYDGEIRNFPLMPVPPLQRLVLIAFLFVFILLIILGILFWA